MAANRAFRCWVRHCINSRKRTRIPNSHYHAFPIKNTDRCRRWLQAVGYEDLIYLPMHSLKLRYVCSEHFTKADYGRRVCNNSLLLTAVPSKFPPGTIPLSDEIMEEWPPKIASALSDQSSTNFTTYSASLASSNITSNTDTLLASAISAGILKPSPSLKVIVPSSQQCHSVKPTDLKLKLNVESVATPSPIVNLKNVSSSSFGTLQTSTLKKMRLSDASTAVMHKPTGSVEINLGNNDSDCEVEVQPSESGVKSKLPPLPQHLLLDYLNQNAGEGLLDGDLLLGLVVKRGSSIMLLPVAPNHPAMVSECLDELSPSASCATTPLPPSNGLNSGI